MSAGTKNWHGLISVAVLSFVSCQSAFPRPIPLARQPVEVKRVSGGTNSVPPKARWHTVTVTPRPGLPKIHTGNKFNPVWWFKNADDPTPPAWYRPDDKHRVAKWRLRNPFHNFDHYVIGVADKKFVRSGRYPERNSNPNGGWDFEVARRKLALLPFVSYQRARFNFYFGWREHGSFGIKLNFPAPPGQPPAKATP